MTAYYDILDLLKTHLLADVNVNTVTQGDIFDVDLAKQTIFPLSHIMVTSITIEGAVYRFGIAILCMDIVDFSKEAATDKFRGNDNEPTALNNQLAVVSRLMELLRRSDNLNVLDGIPTAEPFTERFENNLAGWALSFDLLVENDMTIC